MFCLTTSTGELQLLALEDYYFRLLFEYCVNDIMHLIGLLLSYRCRAQHNNVHVKAMGGMVGTIYASGCVVEGTYRSKADK